MNGEKIETCSLAILLFSVSFSHIHTLFLIFSEFVCCSITPYNSDSSPQQEWNSYSAPWRNAQLYCGPSAALWYSSDMLTEQVLPLLFSCSSLSFLSKNWIPFSASTQASDIPCVPYKQLNSSSPRNLFSYNVKNHACVPGRISYLLLLLFCRDVDEVMNRVSKKWVLISK